MCPILLSFTSDIWLTDWLMQCGISKVTEESQKHKAKNSNFHEMNYKATRSYIQAQIG